jgi:hypothetical protein
MDYMPHGHCFYWQPGILWPFVAANLGIASAYVIGFPWAFLPWLRRNGDSMPTLAAVLLATFVLFCGLGHVFAVANVWMAEYGAETLWHSATAAVSWAFVVAVRLTARRYSLGWIRDNGVEDLSR